jgi:hypothetical protein
LKKLKVKSSEEAGMMIGRIEVEEILTASLAELLSRDALLLENDVSERAITHKLAEYLQRRIPDLNVDCEYNRNVVKGFYEPKAIFVLKDTTQARLTRDFAIDELLELSVYPDIIVHRRGTNNENLLVVEVKKKGSRIDHGHDHSKLAAFTENSEQNSYHYKFGAFVLLETGRGRVSFPKLTWYVEGEPDPAIR